MGTMKRIHTFFLAFFLCFFLGAGEVKAQNAKARALGSMALYGTIGGSLLGTATLAFGNGARAIAQGASLGLYAGLIFGSYVVLSHGFQREYDDEYGILSPENHKNKELLLNERRQVLASLYDPRKKSRKNNKGWGFYFPILEVTY